MNAWYMLMDPKFALYASPIVQARAGGSMGNMAGRKTRAPGQASLFSRIASYFARRALAMELVRLDDRMLGDIGLNREQIPTVLDGMQSGWASRRVTRAERDHLAA